MIQVSHCQLGEKDGCCFFEQTTALLENRRFRGID
jgi:hypothetical protein